MKKMKRLCSILLIAVMILSATACQKQGGGQEPQVQSSAETTAVPAGQEQTTAPAQTEAGGDPIKIGVLATLTGYPLNGEHMRNGSWWQMFRTAATPPILPSMPRTSW